MSGFEHQRETVRARRSLFYRSGGFSGWNNLSILGPADCKIISFVAVLQAKLTSSLCHDPQCTCYIVQHLLTSNRHSSEYWRGLSFTSTAGRQCWSFLALPTLPRALGESALESVASLRVTLPHILMRHLLWNPQWDRLPYCTTQLLPAGEFLEVVCPNQDPELVCAPSAQLHFRHDQQQN